jgi:hypothetical protein
MTDDIPEEHRKRSLVATARAPTTEYAERFSSLAKLARVTVYVQHVGTVFVIPTRKQVILKHQLAV